ncbi:MAG: HDIG domain-containing metalloprotein [Elusimicrobiota bacterium]
MDNLQGLELLKKYVKNENIIKHSIATEAVMRVLAKKFSEDEEKWALTGLLHDIDVDITDGDLKRHTLEAEKILRENGVTEDMIEAIKMHNETASGKKRTEKFHKALASAETITGLIVATALVYPDKKLSSVRTSSVLKRMKEKRFAASVDRNIIMECEDIGIPVEQFVEISLNVMQSVSAELGL